MYFFFKDIINTAPAAQTKSELMKTPFTTPFFTSLHVMASSAWKAHQQSGARNELVVIG
jgi:hypothetical protein